MHNYEAASAEILRLPIMQNGLCRTVNLPLMRCDRSCVQRDCNFWFTVFDPMDALVQYWNDANYSALLSKVLRYDVILRRVRTVISSSTRVHRDPLQLRHHRRRVTVQDPSGPKDYQERID